MPNIPARVIRDPEPDTCGDLASRIAGRIFIDPNDLPGQFIASIDTPDAGDRDKVWVRLDSSGRFIGLGYYTGNTATAAACCSVDGWEICECKQDYKVVPCGANVPEGYKSTGVEMAAVSDLRAMGAAISEALTLFATWTETATGTAIPAVVTLAISNLEAQIAQIPTECFTVVQDETL